MFFAGQMQAMAPPKAINPDVLPHKNTNNAGDGEKKRPKTCRIPNYPLPLHRFLTESTCLDYGVMVAQQILVLFVQVRILVVQRLGDGLQWEKDTSGDVSFFCIHTPRAGRGRRNAWA